MKNPSAQIAFISTRLSQATRNLSGKESLRHLGEARNGLIRLDALVCALTQECDELKADLEKAKWAAQENEWLLFAGLVEDLGALRDGLLRKSGQLHEEHRQQNAKENEG